MEKGRLAVERSGDGALWVRLGGTWRMAGGVPSLDAVRAELARPPLPARASVDGTGVDDWDSAMVAFVAGIGDLCRERGVPLDRDRLPEGARRLLALAEAVPARGGEARARTSWLARVGEGALALVARAADVVRFLGEVTLALGRLLVGRGRIRPGDVLFELQRCGAQAVPIVVLIAFLVGTILAFVGAVQLEQFGASIYVANLVGLAMAREMGAMMTAIIMAGRTGSGFAAEIGTMRVTQETDALTTMGLPPMEALVVPRVLGMTVMMPLLTLVADLVGVTGGAVVGIGMLGLSPPLYLTQTQGAIALGDVALGVAKSVVFGLLVAFAGCFAGMRCGRSSAAVGEATTRAVVSGIVAIIVADGLFAVVSNVLGI